MMLYIFDVNEIVTRIVKFMLIRLNENPGPYAVNEFELERSSSCHLPWPWWTDWNRVVTMMVKSLRIEND